MKIARNKTYIFNPGYQLRHDLHRIVLFSKTEVDENSSQEWCSFIHPVQAGMLSFFTHNRNYEENLRLLSNYFSRDTAYIKKAVSAFIKNPEPVFAQWKQQKIYFPSNILIEKETAEKEYNYLKFTPDYFSCRKIDLTSRRLYTGPLLLTFMLTNRCLTNCRYCYADTSTNINQMLPTSRILELIREAADLKVREVNLIGGEIFLHKDWDIILRELVKYNIEPEFISTKLPLTANHLTKIKETGFRNLIQISLDALDEDILSSSLRVYVSYRDKMKESIRLLDKSGLKYQVSTVLTSYNNRKEVFDEIFSFLSSLEYLRDWRINPVSNSIYINYKEFAPLKAKKEDIESIFSYIEEFLQPTAHFPILLNRETIRKEFYNTEGGSMNFKGSACSALNTHMFILPDGKVTICEQLYWNPQFLIGDVNYNGLKEVWNSPRALQLVQLSKENIQESSNCRNCLAFNKCFNYRNRCWSDIIKAYGEDYWDYPDPRCQLAPQMKNNLGY